MREGRQPTRWEGTTINWKRKRKTKGKWWDPGERLYVEWRTGQEIEYKSITQVVEMIVSVHKLTGITKIHILIF